MVFFVVGNFGFEILLRVLRENLCALRVIYYVEVF